MPESLIPIAPIQPAPPDKPVVVVPPTPIEQVRKKLSRLRDEEIAAQKNARYMGWESQERYHDIRRLLLQDVLVMLPAK